MDTHTRTLRRVVAALIQPSPHLTQRDEQRKAKLLSTILASFIPIEIITIVWSYFYYPDTFFPPTHVTVVLFVSSLFFIAMYALSRTHYLTLTAYLTIGGLTLAIFIASIPQTEAGIELGMLTYLPLSVIVTSVLLSWKASIYVLVACIVGMLLFPFLFFENHLTILLDWMIQVVAVSSTAIIANYFTTLLEQDRRAEIRENEQMLRLTTENMEDVIALVSPEGHYRYISSSLERLTGHPTHLVMHHAARFWAKYIHPDDLPQVKQAFRTTLEEHTPTTYQYRFTCADGRQIWFETIAAPFMDENGNYDGIILTSRNMTERKENEAIALRVAVQNERISTLETFINNMSHDLKTPISVLNTSIYLLEKQTNPEKRQHHLNVLKQQASHLEQLVEDMLMIIRLDNTTTYHFSETSLGSILTTINMRFTDVAAQKHIQLRLEQPFPQTPLQADSEKLCQALGAIVQNSIAYTPNGGAITLRGGQQNGHLVIEVEDTGIGIGADDLPHIFERFYRADSARSSYTGGTGLGLSIAQKIIESHGGKIEATSTLGAGSKFQIRLPTH